mmetsp:Transcript_49644/g.74922  ORF Transcript_49644/g.74922 Transcript_49644/m.74922 type:complete len:176 (+) Transcript_49644:120-647(+)
MPSISAHRARLLLQLYQRNPTRGEIQDAFLRAAKKYHPDKRHPSNKNVASSTSPSSSSSAVTFRECLEAREILLKQQKHGFHHSIRRATTGTHYNSSSSSSSFFASGFPTKTLRVLTLKQNLALRGMVMLSLTFLAVYEEYASSSRKKGDMGNIDEEEYVIKNLRMSKEEGGRDT